MNRSIRNTIAIVLSLALLLVIPVITSVAASGINSATGSIDNGKVVVKGTTDASVLSVAAILYDANNNQVEMKTTGVDDNYAFEVTFETTADATYTVRVANYDGGDFTYVSLGSSSNSTVDPTNGNTVINKVPKTGDLF